MNKFDGNDFELKNFISEKEIIEEYNKIAELSLYNKDDAAALSDFDLKISKENKDFACFLNEIGLNENKLFSKRNILLSLKNPNSSIQLQNNLIGISEETINYLLNELKGEFREIIKDKNGNYFFSSLIKKCNKEQRSLIIKELYNTISEDCLDEFANHSFQALIEISSNEEEYKLLLSSFNDCNKIAMATMNQYGTYVICKLIQHIPETIRAQFDLMFVKLICTFSRNKFGVYAVEKFIRYSKSDIIKKEIFDGIMANFIDLAKNQFGNYVIQFVLNRWWKKNEGILIKKEIKSKFNILMQNQYSFYICKLYINLIKNSN
jgi:hypothetical protein